MKSGSQFIFSVLGILITLSGCHTKKVSHEQEVKYYVQIWSVGFQHINAWNQMNDELAVIRNIAKQNEEEKISLEIADTLEVFIDTYLQAVDSSLLVMKEIKELDQELKTVNKMKTYLHDSKKHARNNLTRVMDFLLKGLRNLSKNENSVFESIVYEEKRLISVNDWMYLQLQRFAYKHHVYKYEMDSLRHEMSLKLNNKDTN